MPNANRFLPIPRELLDSVLVVPPSPQYPSGLMWVTPRARRLKPGDVAGCLSGKKGLRQDWIIGFNNNRYLVSRVIYAKLIKDPGNLTVDHIDRNPLNNKITNLRLANRVQQSLNRDIKSKSDSGVVGISWSERAKKWRVRIQLNNKINYLGNYLCLLDAYEAYIKSELLTHSIEFKFKRDAKKPICLCKKCKKKPPHIEEAKEALS
jgi:hypothetical protein